MSQRQHDRDPLRDEIDWADDATPVSRRFDDPYFSRADGLAETRHVFLAGNDLPARFRPGFHIAELGFGTGLNLLAAWQCWRAQGPGGNLRFTSFEAFPLQAGDMARALAAFPELADLARPLVETWVKGKRRFGLAGLEVEVVEGDARETLPRWPGRADAWFLDGFAPARNPEMWEPTLLGQLAAHSRPGATLASYTAAGAVRRALDGDGFTITRRPGFGRKRHMITGILRG